VPTEKESPLEMAIKEEGAARAIYVGAVVDDVLAQTDAEDDSDRDLCHRRKVEAESKHGASIDRLVVTARYEQARQMFTASNNVGCSQGCECCVKTYDILKKERDRLLAEMERKEKHD
jgi:hypothetical protein